MLQWVLDTYYAHLFHTAAQTEHSVVVYDSQEALLTPLMQSVERDHPGISVFSLPSVDHPVHGRHIELGVKGLRELVPAAWKDLASGLHQFDATLGPEMVRER